ncbi:cilia- and flagella-associated protein 206 [Caerostris extrusa]|uniref:Cilia- and flagella-associated protein 206 n=1 Tax=Caerostris extrusa TaxID=172846 RepID=A0AAV4Q3Y1_CAEEX|nr:cilia- and flagella-associated protein 206 [Caerostris extrusa]
MAFINEVSSISAGIRLHAWYSQKAGKFMFDVARIMRETLPKVTEDLHEELSSSKEKIQFLREELLQKVSEDVSEDDKEMFHQKLLLISLENIDEVAVQTYRLDYTFAVQIKDLNAGLKTGPFTKADRVYRINATGPEDVPEILLPVDNAEEIAKGKIPPLFFRRCFNFQLPNQLTCKSRRLQVLLPLPPSRFCLPVTDHCLHDHTLALQKSTMLQFSDKGHMVGS